jgi:hypothetical protein
MALGVGVAVAVAVAVGVGEGKSVGVGVGLGGGVTVAVAVAVAVGVGVGLDGGVTVAVAVAVAVGVGVGVASFGAGATTSTETGEPVLKKPMFAVVGAGGASESNRKLYSVPKRIALAFWFWAKVSQFQVAEKPSLKSHAVLLYPASPWVPSCANPGCCGGAWNPILVRCAKPNG